MAKKTAAKKVSTPDGDEAAMLEIKAKVLKKTATKKPAHKPVKRTAKEIKRDHEVISGIKVPEQMKIEGTVTGRVTHKKSKPISTRLPKVDIEYDGTEGRTTAHFKDANDAKAAFIRLDKRGKNPKVIGEMKLKVVQTELPKKPTLAEVFPADPVDPNIKQIPGPHCTGDPTETKADQLELPDEEAAKAEAKKKASDKKDAKRLRKLKKKNKFLWLTADTKTIVNCEYTVPQGGYYERWLLTFDDKTQDSVSNLSVVWSRDHEEHHIRTPNGSYKDGLSNKQYELVLHRCQQDAARRARYLSSSLKNFKGSPDVQKEMDKKISKQSLKEEPLTLEQVELAKRIADLANLLCCAPSMFFALPAKQKKLWIGGGDNIAKLDLTTHGIDEADCTIRVMQYATRLHGRMIPRLEIGGPQIGDPELAKKYEKERAELAKQPKAPKAPKEPKVKAEKAPKAPKEPKPVKPKEEVDAFGNKKTTGCGLINAEILAAKPGVVFDKDFIAKVVKKTKQGHAPGHFRTLSIKGHLTRLEDGTYVLKGHEPKKSPAKASKSKGKEVKRSPSKPSAKASTVKTIKKTVKTKSPKKTRK